MDDTRLKRLKIVNITTIVIIIVLAGFILFLMVKGRNREVAPDPALKAKIVANAPGDNTDIRVLEYLTEEYGKAVIDKKLYKEWLNRVSNDSYKAVQLSMWTTSDRMQYWYDTYFGEGYEIVDYNFKNPAELSAFLERVAGSGNTLDRIILYIDPYEFYENYMAGFVVGDEQPLAFQQMLRDCLLDYVVDHPDIVFSVNLPIFAQNYWLDLTTSELSDVLDCWSSLIHYAGWGNDVRVHALGLEKWVFFNTFAFENGKLKEASEDLMISIENTDQYCVEYDRADSVVELFKEYIREARRNGYKHHVKDNAELIFFGDSIMGTPTRFEPFTIPEIIGGLSGTKVFNLAIGGSSASREDDPYSFVNMTAKFVAGENAFPEGINSRLAFEEFLLDPEDGLDKVFVIGYGFNDYTVGISTEAYIEGLRKGIEKIQGEFPDADYVLLSPLYSSYSGDENYRYSEAGGTLPEYALACEALAEELNIGYIDMYHGPVNKETASTYLYDQIHPEYAGAFETAEYLVAGLAKLFEE